MTHIFVEFAIAVASGCVVTIFAYWFNNRNK